MKMANKGKKPIRQTNTANHPQRTPNYNYSNNNYTMKPNSNINRNIDMNNNRQYRLNNNDMGMNMMNEYSSNNSNILPRQNNKQYNQIKSMENRKPITANDYNRNHNYNIYKNNNNYQENKAPRRVNNGYNNNNYNNFNNYNNKNNNYNNYNNNNNGDEDNRPIGGGLTEEQMPDENSPTSPCPHCGRSFNQMAFGKHVKICEKVFLKKRKAFNTQKQRINDSEQASLMKQGALEAKTNPMLNQNKKQGEIPKWKLQSMAFRAICNPGKNNPSMNQMTMKNNKNAVANYKNYRGGMNNNQGMVGNFGNNNTNMGGYVSSAVAYGYKHCEYCNRNYNEEAYNKHLNFCKRKFEDNKIKNRGKKTAGNGNVSNNLAKKNQYGNALSNGVKYNSGKYNKKK